MQAIVYGKRGNVKCTLLRGASQYWRETQGRDPFEGSGSFQADRA